MTRESRLIVTLLVVSGIGVAGLMVVANQYRKALTNAAPGSVGGGDDSVRAVRLVDGYLAARTAAKAVVEHYPGKIEQPTADVTSTYRIERFNAFTAHGMTYEDYASVRTAWRTFRAGGLVDDPALVAAFQARQEALENAGLGPVEALDDAIK